MHIETKDSLGIEDLFEFKVFDTADEIDKDAGKPNVAAMLANMYMGQKDGLVKQRRALRAKVHELTKFPHDPAKQKTETQKDGKVVTKNTETEGDYFDRLKANVIKGTFKHALFNGDGEEGFKVALKKIARSLGVYTLSAKEAEKVAGKERKPPLYALNAAESIIGNKTEAKWLATFAKEGIQHQAFTAKAEKGATPEEAAAVAATNKANLAWAIKAREDAKAMKEYV